MIRVAAVIEALGPGGAERLLVDTARRIDRRKFALRVFTLFAVRRHYAQALADLGVEETCLDLRGPRDFPRGVSQLRRALRERPMDVVHTHLFGANVVGRTAARLSGLPVVSTLHDADYEPITREGNPGLSGWKHGLLRLIDQATLRAARAEVVAVSRYVGDSARRHLHVRAERTTVIHNGIDTTVFRPGTPEERAHARSEMGATGDEVLALCVARMTPQKGHAVLLDALGILGPSRRVRAAFAGDGDLRPVLEARARELGVAERVRFLGVRSDVPELMRGADVVVLPSLHEGFGLALAEAMASGLPVVASDTGPVPEIVEHDRSGILFPPGDARALSVALDRLMESEGERAAMGGRGRARAMAEFSFETMIGRLEALYERLARREPLPS
jgi:glycosyltransferase involved in cell wall biosynthesis